jgi:serine/threonine-protein phosphatase PGAM5
MPHRLLYLVRHGAYEPDATDPVEGGGLTELGRQQASLLADRLADVDFTVVHHSSSLRAVQTADLLAFRMAAVPRRGDDLLRECIPSIPDDRFLTEGQRKFFAQLPIAAREQGPVQAAAALARFTTPTGEDTRELVVSHGNLINFFVSKAMDGPEHGWLRPLDYHCGLTVIRYSDIAPPRMICYNDVGHLPAELRGIEYPPGLRI